MVGKGLNVINCCVNWSVFADSSVLTGSLTWGKIDNENRTTARFSLTLSLSRSQFPTAAVGKSVFIAGAVVEYGDGETTGDNPMKMEV